MTSVLNVDTIADKAGTGPVGLTKQIATKAWASFVMYSSLSTRDTFGCSSLTDFTTGDLRMNLTNAMSNTNYAAVGSACDAINSFSNGQRCAGAYYSSTTVTGIVFTYANNSAVDPEVGVGQVTGDLA